MALNLESKKAVVEEVAEIAAKAHSAVAAEYRGLTVTELTELRKTARETGVYLRVVKNTLAKRAIAGTEFECMQSAFVGPLLIAFSMEDPGSAARLISNFYKGHDKLITRIVAIGGQSFDGSELNRLASLPTRDQGIGLLMSAMKAPVEKLVRTLAAIKDQKQAA
ncbi:50S ribosomal subunit protein L10 [Candidatus Methylobacter favarea]|uniref:Large ribosomal subunit protein uL10 n=1 Tax=Candidatus Methylobacter favarea TaxID=2707345 RepID=A0A8S0WHQ5_9GAMM|nr:50S ribosomal protein L10 [Candidatus Methylobacter favarea]CAA9889991.1 50S ribosomal subunit protein L10 [Candidatus Methylobacter favarea]